jgi:hypothetical protein
MKGSTASLISAQPAPERLETGAVATWSSRFRLIAKYRSDLLPRYPRR